VAYVRKRFLLRPLQGYIEDEALRAEIIEEHLRWLNGRLPSEIYRQKVSYVDVIDSPVYLFLKDTPKRKLRERQQRRLKKCRQL